MLENHAEFPCRGVLSLVSYDRRQRKWWKMRVDIAARSDIGRRKTNNEDSFGVFGEDTPDLRLFQEGALLCVADGLGGHEGGEIASKLAVSIVRDLLKQEPPHISGYSDEVDERNEGPLPLLRGAIRRANQSIFQTNKDLMRTRKPMGTTLLAAIIEPKRIYVGNVGDSRCYHIRDFDIIAMTEDHSWVDEQVKLGLMTRDEAEKDRRKNIVTRCIGTHEDVAVDTYRWNVLPGDMLLLCSDGLVNMVSDSDILAVFRRYRRPKEIVDQLVDLANRNGGRDNITVLVAQVSPSALRLKLEGIQTFVRSHGYTLGWVIFTMLFGLLCLVGGIALHSMGIF